MNNNVVCSSRSPFAAGVKAHCACWQHGLNSSPSAAQPFCIPELQELAAVLPVKQLYQTVHWISHFTAGASERVFVHVMSDTLGERDWGLSQTQQ